MIRSIAVAAVALLAATASASPTHAQDAAPAATHARASAPLNVNTATAEQFEALPGLGAKTAARIVEYRQKNGGFKKLEDLMNVRGIGEKNFLRLKPLLTLGAPPAERAAVK
jgi:competence protein ComEA